MPNVASQRPRVSFHLKRWNRSRTIAMKRFFALAVVSLLILGCKKPTDAPVISPQSTDSYDAATPLVAFTEAREAAAKLDWKRFCGYLTPQARDTLAASLTIAGNMIRRMTGAANQSNEDISQETHRKADPIIQVLTKHKIAVNVLSNADDDQADALPSHELIDGIVADIEDRDQFVADMLAAMTELESVRPTISFKGSLVNVNIEGDTATATVEQMHQGKMESESLSFRKIDGNWRIEFNLQ